MKKMLLLTAMTLLSGCFADYRYEADYNFKIKRATVDGNPVTLPDGTSLVFQDQNFKIYLLPEYEGVSFALENLTDKTAKIIWDESVMIINNQPSKVFHTGMKIIDKDKSIPPSIVPGKTLLKDMVLPSDYTSFFSGGSGVSSRWIHDGILPEMRRRAQESEYNNFKTSVEKLNGADIYDLLLTIEYGGQKHEYFFDFHIASTQIREIVKNGAKLEPL